MAAFSGVERGMRISLLRHGEVEGAPAFRGRTDAPLSEAGWRQMEQAVAGRRWARIWTSPLARCLVFAERLAERLDAPLRLDERLAELDFGDWEGLTAAEVMARDSGTLARFWEDPARHPPPGGEDLASFEARVMAAWAEIRALEPGPVLVVTHGGVIRLLRCRLEGRPLSELLQLEVGHASLHDFELPAAAGRLQAQEA
ncbi:MAG TPA: histidine phosphatase family protein [Thiotrichales bacterium]|nr:histidine phosphatase family protein [Thiotrichales bacterium]